MTDYKELYRRMKNVAAGYSNFCEESGSTRRLEKEYEAIEQEARLAAPMPQPEPTSKGEVWNMEKLTNILRTYGHSGLLDAVNFAIAEASHQREPQEAAEADELTQEQLEAIDARGPIIEGWRLTYEHGGRNGPGIYARFRDLHRDEDCFYVMPVSVPQEASKPDPYLDTRTWAEKVAFSERVFKEASKVEPVAEGWKLVPVKPTEDMLYKMAECDGYLRGDRDHPMLTQWEDYWNMALEASPSPLALSDEDLDLLWLEHRPPGVSNEEQYQCARKFARAILAAAGGSEK